MAEPVHPPDAGFPESTRRIRLIRAIPEEACIALSGALQAFMGIWLSHISAYYYYSKNRLVTGYIMPNCHRI